MLWTFCVVRLPVSRCRSNKEPDRHLPLQVRGQKSVNGGSTPLIVMDGVIYMGSFRDIDPTTIESMSILKDATSLAAYGSQAANGVIMITTKKGKLGKPVINVNTSWAFSTAAAKRTC